ncbi:ABC transporter permease [Rhodococcus sp. NPDC127530]|uniref:ABC transporter permease n=1 Tax=unclassified Rhodococcus (in: high G+C Gram-positive bacteria) TaxID=192944 RepID=UPI003645291C
MTALLVDSEDTAPGTSPVGADSSRRSAREGFWISLIRQPGLVLSFAVLALVVAWAIVPEVFSTHDPINGVPAQRLSPPSAEHWFGTDNLGRDTYARVVHGAALTLQATVVAVLVGIVVGAGVGLIAGFVRGRVEDWLMRIIEVMLAVPGLLLSLAVVTALGFGTVNVAIAVGIANIASFARVMRSETLKISALPYIEASKASGSHWSYTLFAHVLRNARGPVLALTALEFGTAILSVSALSFLGFGAQPPTPEWGALVSDGRDYLASAWWMTTFPGLVIAIVVLSANRIARFLENR